MKLKNMKVVVFQKNINSNTGSKTFPSQYQFNSCGTLTIINFRMSSVNICTPKAV